MCTYQGDSGDHIKFTSFGDDDNDGSGCWSYFGILASRGKIWVECAIFAKVGLFFNSGQLHRRGGEQVVNLEIPSCLTKYTIFHEVFQKVDGESRNMKTYF